MERHKKTVTKKVSNRRANGASVRALQAKIKELETERDYYLKALYTLLPKPKFRLTRKEMQEMERSGLTLGKVIEELEKELRD